MKVLHYIPNIDKSSGGVGAYMQILANSLGKKVELHIATRHSTNEIDINNCCIHFIKGKLSNYFSMKKAFQKLLDEIKPDIVHVNGCWMLQLSWVAVWAKKKNFPVVISPHGMLEPWEFQKNRWKKKMPAIFLYQKHSLKIADALIATADTEEQNLKKDNWNRNIFLVPNGIITEGIQCRESWKKNNKLIYIGLLRENKGADILIKAISIIKKYLNGYNVVIYGTCKDDYDQHLKQLIKELEIEHIVSIPGGIYGENKWNEYRSADAFILPTLNENFGIVIAESYLCGTPVITTKGAPWPVIEKENLGWWIDRNPQKFAEAILQLINTKEEERKEMGLKGRKYVIENFDSDIVATKMVEVYSKILKQ